jgi:hypothetical protein
MRFGEVLSFLKKFGQIGNPGFICVALAKHFFVCVLPYKRQHVGCDLIGSAERSRAS